MLVSWNQLPDNMKNPQVRRYYIFLSKKRFSLVVKRVFDIAVSFGFIVAFSASCSYDQTGFKRAGLFPADKSDGRKPGFPNL